MLSTLFKDIKIKNCLVALVASCFLAFGLYNIHSISSVTEGGTLGLTLLIDHWFNISPAISGFVLNGLCYFTGWRLLGRKFVVYSAVSTVGFSVSYKIFELFPPIWPQLQEMPLLAAIIGSLFVGVGVGVSVRMGGAPCGDDALAMSLSKLFKIKIQWVYLFSDIIVLGLSATYIPWQRLVYSLITVLLSGQIIGLIQRRVK